MDTIERKKQSIRKSTVSVLFPGFVCLMSYVEGLYWVHHLLHIEQMDEKRSSLHLVLIWTNFKAMVLVSNTTTTKCY